MDNILIEVINSDIFEKNAKELHGIVKWQLPDELKDVDIFINLCKAYMIDAYLGAPKDERITYLSEVLSGPKNNIFVFLIDLIGASQAKVGELRTPDVVDELEELRVNEKNPIFAVLENYDEDIQNFCLNFPSYNYIGEGFPFENYENDCSVIIYTNEFGETKSYNISELVYNVKLKLADMFVDYPPEMLEEIFKEDFSNYVLIAFTEIEPLIRLSHETFSENQISKSKEAMTRIRKIASDL